VAYVRGTAFDEVPTLRMIAATETAIGRRANRARREIERRTGTRGLAEVVAGVSRTGGGSSPTGERPTRLLAIKGPDGGDAGSLERRLREGDPPIVARVQDGRLLIDLRTVLPEQDDLVIERLAALLPAGASPVRR